MSVIADGSPRLRLLDAPNSFPYDKIRCSNAGAKSMTKVGLFSGGSSRFGRRAGFRVFGLALCLVVALNPLYAQSSSSPVQGPEQDPEQENIRNPEFFPLDQVRPGMKGIGLSTFQGDKVEEFEVEVLGVLENFAPRRNMILARLSGSRLQETGILAGMSGSPVYLEGKLLGAVAFGFPFAKEPIGGITPIGDMMDIVPRETPDPAAGEVAGHVSSERSSEGAPPSPQVSRALPWRVARAVNASASSGADEEILRWIPSWESPEDLPAAFQHFPGAPGVAAVPSWQRVPLLFNGFTQQGLDALLPQWRAFGFEPILGVGSVRSFSPDGEGGGLSGAEALRPGSMVSVHLIRGDLNIKADCTVTLRIEDQIYACGHGFLQSGRTELPFSPAKVITLIPSVFSSFKLSSAGPVVGTIRQDRSSGIQGVIGERARMIPVHMTLSSTLGRQREYHLEIVQDALLSPLLLNQALIVSIAATERRLGLATFEIRGRIRLSDGQTVEIEDIAAGDTNSHMAVAASVAGPLRVLLSSGFPGLAVEGIELSVISINEKRLAKVDQVWSEKSEIGPGEEFTIHAQLRMLSGEIRTQKLTVATPENLTGRFLTVVVGSGQMANRYFVPRFSSQGGSRVAQDLRQLVRALNHLRGKNRLYVLLMDQKRALFLQGEEFPSPPPSLLQIFQADPSVSTNMASTGFSIIGDSESEALPYAIQGQRTLRLRVKNSAAR